MEVMGASQRQNTSPGLGVRPDEQAVQGLASAVTFNVGEPEQHHSIKTEKLF